MYVTVPSAFAVATPLLAATVTVTAVAHGSTPFENARESLAKDRLADACNQIADFIVEVEAKTPAPIPESEARALNDSANPILVILGCGRASAATTR